MTHKVFEYAFEARPTLYKGILFQSRLKARWAVFFDRAGLEWQYEPIDLVGWTPDFYIKLSCSYHSECCGYHDLLIEVKPYFNINQFFGHPCMNYPNGHHKIDDKRTVRIPADASAAFGASPRMTYWEMCHGADSRIFSIKDWVDDCDILWTIAGRMFRRDE